jgi:hypothetical protein
VAGLAVALTPGVLRPVKTDAREADVIADAARTLPHTLRRVDARDEVLALGDPAWGETRRS